jgi:hypothetical protein
VRSLTALVDALLVALRADNPDAYRVLHTLAEFDEPLPATVLAELLDLDPDAVTSVLNGAAGPFVSAESQMSLA